LVYFCQLFLYKIPNLKHGPFLAQQLLKLIPIWKHQIPMGQLDFSMRPIVNLSKHLLNLLRIKLFPFFLQQLLDDYIIIQLFLVLILLDLLSREKMLVPYFSKKFTKPMGVLLLCLFNINQRLQELKFSLKILSTCDLLHRKIHLYQVEEVQPHFNFHHQSYLYL